MYSFNYSMSGAGHFLPIFTVGGCSAFHAELAKANVTSEETKRCTRGKLYHGMCITLSYDVVCDLPEQLLL